MTPYEAPILSHLSKREVEDPIYSGYYKSIIQYIDIDSLNLRKRGQLGIKTLGSFSRALSGAGFLKPVFVTRDLSVADGEKRIAAAAALGYVRVPCVPFPTPLVFEDDLLIRELSSDPLHFFEYAKKIKELTERFLYTQEALASILDKSQSYIANKLRLLNFGDDERAAIEEASLCERHCRALLRIKDEELRKAALDTVIASSMNVSAAEEYVAEIIPRKCSGLCAEFEGELRSFIRRRGAVDGITATESSSPDGSVTFSVTISK